VAGPTTAERGERQQESSGPPPRRPGWKRPGLRAAVVLTAGLAVVGGGAAWLLYGSSWLRVERVSVSGTRVLTDAEVRAAAEVPTGAPLVSVDTGTIESRVRKALPRVDSVEAVRSWPHGISLRVTERSPVLIVKNPENKGNFTEVDDEGVRFASVANAPKGVPLLDLSLSATGTRAASLRRFDESRLVREAVRVAGTIPAAVARDTRTVKVRSYDDISLELTRGRTVAWGSAEKGTEKARALTALMKAASGAGHFDVSVPTAPSSAAS
jgi:cell division protein FtsQ